MVSVRAEALLDADRDEVWAVIGDFASGPVRMAPGFVAASRAEAGVRTVTFADGAVVRERLVGVDEAQRRIAYAVVGGSVQPDHDNASMQVLSAGPGRSRLVWVRDVLPDELGPPMQTAMEAGTEVIRRRFACGGPPR